MGEILGLGITHYPGLCYKGNLTRRIKMLLADPLLPERLRSPEGWHPTMREQWSTDEAPPTPRSIGSDMIHHFRKARAELDAFEPDFVLVWGDDQYENFRRTASLRSRCSRMTASTCSLERAPTRRELVGRAGRQDVHGRRPPQGRQARGVGAGPRRYRRRLRLQAATPSYGPRLHELAAVPGLRPEGSHNK